MLPDYDDIRSLIDREPDWFGGGGVPRYRPFEPEMLGVYDEWALLVEIACQDCGRPVPRRRHHELLRGRKIEAWRKVPTDAGWKKWERDTAVEAIDFIHDCVLDEPPTS